MSAPTDSHENSHSEASSGDEDSSHDAAAAASPTAAKLVEVDPQKAQEYKKQGNEVFGKGDYKQALELYANALDFLPDEDKENRAAVHNNCAACYVMMKDFKLAVEECSLAIDLCPTYTKAIRRRARANEQLEHLAEAVNDLKKLVELDPSDKEAAVSLARVSKALQEQQEKQKEEMLSKLKDLGNGILGKFGMSLDNFKTTKDPTTGSYSVSFQK